MRRRRFGEDAVMHFAETFIRRPVLASMVSLGIVLVGAISYTRLPVREFPDADPPIVSVTVLLPGASPQVMESAVTDVLEEELSSLEGLRTMSSASQEQRSEEHTSELQSPCNLVCRLLLEKKKKQNRER